MPDNTVFTDVIYRARLDGVDQVNVALKRMQDGADKAAASGRPLQTSYEGLERALAKSAFAYDPAAKMAAIYTREVKNQQLAVALGIRTQDEATSHLGMVEAALRKSATAHVAHASAVGLNRMQMLELAHVGRSFADGLASGASPARLLAMEGGRLTQALSQGEGGVGGSLRAIGGLALSIVSPFRLAGLAITGTALAAGIAFKQFDSQLDSMQTALNGRGRGSGLTLDALNSLAERSAGAGGITTSAARSLATGYAGAGLSADLVGGLTVSTQKYARATGEDLTAAGKELTGMFVDPAKGIDTFEAKLGNLDERTRMLITTQEREGNILGARESLYGAVNQRLSETADRTWLVTRAWDAATAAASSYWAHVQHLTEAPTRDEKITGLTTQLLSLPPNQLNNPWVQKQQSQLTAQLDAELKGRAKENADALVKQRASDLADLNKQADSLIAGALPDLMQRQTLTAHRDTLSSALGGRADRDPNTLGFPTTDALRALDAYNHALTTALDPLQKQRAEGALMLADINAITVSERANVAAERERLNLAGQLKGSAESELAVQQARLRVLEEAGRAVQDQLRTSQQQLALAGLSPYARGRAEILQQSDDLRRQYDPNYVAPGTVNRSTLPLLPGSTGGGFGGGTTVDMIRAAAIARGIDPSQALTVAKSEGLNSYYGDYTNGAATSFGPFQLHTGGGLGDLFQKQTGLDLHDQSTIPQQVNFALDQALKPGGWTPWHGWHGDPRAGLPGGPAGNVNPTLMGSATANQIGSNIGSITSNKLAAYDKDQLTGFSSPLGSAQRDIDALNRSTANSTTTWGQSAQAIAEAGEKLKLTNDYINQGIPPTGDLALKIDDVAKKYGVAAAAADELAKKQQMVSGVIGDARGLFDAFGSTVLNGFMQGKHGADLLRDGVRAMAQDAARIGLSTFENQLFGKQGATGPGAFGLIGGLIAKGFGLGAPSMGAYGLGVGVDGLYADGGLLSGPGHGRSDNLLIRASPGEYIINAPATSANRPILDAINSGRIPAFADGGMLSPTGEFGQEMCFGEVLQ